MYLQITKYIRSHNYKKNVWNGLTTLRQTILCASNISGTTSHQCRCNTLEPCNGKMVPWGIGCKTDPPFQLLSLHTMPANLIIMHTEIGDKGGVGGWNENANGREGQCLISVFWAVTDAQLQTNKQKQKQLLVSNNESICFIATRRTRNAIRLLIYQKQQHYNHHHYQWPQANIKEAA